MKWNMIFIFYCLFLSFSNVAQSFTISEAMKKSLKSLPKEFSPAIVDIVIGMGTHAVTIVRGNTTDIRSDDIFEVMCVLSEKNIQVVNLDLTTQENKDRYYRFLKQGLDTSEERTSLILCEPLECENLLFEITVNNYIHRSMVYIFFWPRGKVSKLFLSGIKEAIRVVVITNPRSGVFRLYYNQASPNKLNHLTLVNWWAGRLYKSPALPPASMVYHHFQGRVFHVPVLHAPPWHFVRYNNDSSVNVTGGRDDKLLSLLARKLNFQYKYYDPPERSQGSKISGNGTFKGTLGLIWKRVSICPG